MKLPRVLSEKVYKKQELRESFHLLILSDLEDFPAMCVVRFDQIESFLHSFWSQVKGFTGIKHSLNF